MNARALSFALLCAACATSPSPAPAREAPQEAAESRPASWAQPLARTGLPNLHQLTPDLYRSAQPEAEGFAELERMGVRTVLSLRGFHDDALPADGALRYERISFKTWHPEEEDVVRFLRLVRDPACRPVLVHCQHGADRTGMMCAVYRIVEQGWSKDEALREMTAGGFGFHPLWQNLVAYVRALDVEHLRARVDGKN